MDSEPKTEAKISIIIIHYNTPDYLKGCFEAILAQTYQNIEIIFIDNNSPDDSGLKYVREKYSENPKIQIVANKENLGYSGAANQGIRMAIEGKNADAAMKNIDWPPASDFVKADYVVITNPDILYTPQYFEKLIERVEKDPKIAAATGKVYKYDFTNQSPTDIIDTVGLIAYKNIRIADDGQGLIDEGQFNEEAFVFGVSGACPLYRTKALEDVKLMDEYFDNDFFMYKEDVDLSWRFLLYGWKNLYFPQATAYHGRGTGVVRRFKTGEVLKNRRMLSKFQKTYSFRNQLLMEKKNLLWGTFWRNFIPIIFKRSALLIYTLIFEPYLLKCYWQYLKMLPRVLKKRKLIMQSKRINAKQMEKFFVKRSKYLET